MLQRHSIEKLHGDEGVAMLIVDFVNGADVGMVQCRGSLGLPLKTAERLRIIGNIVGQELERHEPAEFDILRLVDHAHATAAQLFYDVVMGDFLADHAAPQFAGL
jgi:hypothetical protein